MNVLVFSPYFLPSYKCGGPVRTLASLINFLGSDISFWVVSKDRDSGELKSFSGVKVDDWNSVGKAKVFYFSPESFKFSLIEKLTDEVAPQIIYLNGFFNFLTMKVLLYRKIFSLKHEILLAPRGEMADGALILKSWKKKLYLWLSKRLGLYENVIFHASSVKEKEDIIKNWHEEAQIKIAANLPDLPNFEKLEFFKKKKSSGSAQFLFLSRIHPTKNLGLLLDCLSEVKGEIELIIVGYLDDKNYWKECERKIENLPKEINVKYMGVHPHETIFEFFQRSHFFVLPTLGENFGHVIFEAMINSCPVIISDRTIWNKIGDENAGWALPLEKKTLWIEKLVKCVEMGPDDYLKKSKASFSFALNWLKKGPHIKDNRALFGSESN